MPDQALRRRVGLITSVRRFRILSYGFEIHTADGDLARRLDYLVPGAAQPGGVTATYRFQAERSAAGYRIQLDGRHLDDAPDVDNALNRLYVAIYDVASAQVADSVLIHAGTGLVDGRRFLAVGSKFTGKSTLMTRLLFDGAAAEGDELAILADGEVTAFPRRFRIRTRALPHLPELTPLLVDIPTVRGPDGECIYGFDPSSAGYDWTIGTGPLDAIFFLCGDHGGDAEITACPRIDMCRLVMPQCLSLEVPDSQVLARVTAMVGKARTYTVRGGSPRSIAAALVDCMGG